MPVDPAYSPLLSRSISKLWPERLNVNSLSSGTVDAQLSVSPASLSVEAVPLVSEVRTSRSTSGSSAGTTTIKAGGISFLSRIRYCRL